jgi:hypothetical protein
MTVHTAPGQTAGYLYQCRYALLFASQHTASSPSLQLSIEHLDDVAFEEGAELLQCHGPTHPHSEISRC